MKVKIDPKKIEYDGRSFRLIIGDEDALLRRLKEKQQEMLKDLQNEEEHEMNKVVELNKRQ